MCTSIRTVLAVLSFLASSVTAHTWNEQFSLIASNGSYVGAYGYPRGYVARTDPGFNGDSMNYLLPPLSSGRTRINSTDLLCHPAQRTSTQPGPWPRLTVAPGSAVAMKYLENGHVSLPQNQKGKPAKGGTVFVFGTTQPAADEKLTDVLQWTYDGTGGDKRGVLLTANNFDDDRCYQLNSGAISTQRQQQFPDHVAGQPTSQHEQWCETDVVLPKDPAVMQTGKLFTIYWVWQWPTAPGQDPGLPTGKDEYYTTCSDFQVAASVPEAPPSNFLPQQDPQMSAVSDYASRTAITTLPVPATSSGLASSVPSTPSSAPVVTATPTLAPVPTTSSTHAPLVVQEPASTAAASGDIFSSTITIPLIAVPASPTTSTSLAMTTVTVTHETMSATDSQPVLTALVTVVATMPPGLSTFIVEGTHFVTFTLPTPSVAVRALGKRGLEFEAEDVPLMEEGRAEATAQRKLVRNEVRGRSRVFRGM